MKLKMKCITIAISVFLFTVSFLSSGVALGAWDGGHNVTGCILPRLEWYFAEGTTRTGFSEWLCVQNPGGKDTQSVVTFMLENGEKIERRYSLKAKSRTTVNVNSEVPSGRDVSIVLRAETPVVAERPMYFRYRGVWTGGHNVIGATSPADSWYFAEGTCRPGFESFLCLANPYEKDASLNITYMLGDGSEKEKEISVKKHSRTTIKVNDFLGTGDDSAHDFSCHVKSTNGVGIVAERPMYFSYLPDVKWTLVAVGDVNLGGDMNPILQSRGYDYPWSQVSGRTGEATLTFANLECTLSHSGSPLNGKTFTFRGDPLVIGPMHSSGVDVVSQANNHARDYGGESLVECLANLDAGSVAHCGAGSDYISAHTAAFLDACGLRVAFLAYNDISYDGIPGWQAGPSYPGIADAADSAGIVRDIVAAKEEADIVVVSYHWGVERSYVPNARQQELAHLAIDAGADLVLGHHPHVVQGFQFYHGKLIANSLGNFIFNPGSEAGRYTVLTNFEMNASGFLSATVYPYYISSGRPEPMTGESGTNWITNVASMSTALGTPMRVEDGIGKIP